MLLASYAFHAGYVTCVCLVCDVFMFPRYKGKEIILSFTIMLTAASCGVISRRRREEVLLFHEF